jgi:cellulose synthase/poly-beta-1,6-N-acetylglucosamine synthase-like glycosyltransferase
MNNRITLIKNKPSTYLVEKTPDVSVIVPVRNRAKDLRDCLESIVSLEHTSFEIIVVDDQSDDETWEVASRYPVKLLKGKGKGAYAARNVGVGAAKGAIVAFTDSDCIVDKDWLKNITECYSDDTVAGVGGRVLAAATTRVLEVFQSLGPQEVVDSDWRHELGSLERGLFLNGLGSGNMSFRLQALKEVNGFAEDMDKCGDYEICWRIQKRGYRLLYEPEAKVYHKPRSTLAELVIQSYRSGRSQPQFLKKRHNGYSYFELRTYLSPTREYRLRLPVQMLVSLDFFYLATIVLMLALLNLSFLVPFLALGAICYRQAWKKTAEVTNLSLRLRLLLVFPILYALRSYAQSLGRIAGGLTNGIIAL